MTHPTCTILTMSDKDDVFLKETENLRNLRALEEIANNPSLSQRDLAKQLGVALGIANACVHALVRKGLVKIRGDNNRSVTYHLTKRGLLHKSELALRWTRNTISFYAEARHGVSLKLAALKAEGVQTIVLYGANELAEIAAIVAPETGLEIKGFVDGEAAGKQRLLDLMVVTETMVGDFEPDALLVCVEMSDDLNSKLSAYSKSGIRVCHLI